MSILILIEQMLRLSPKPSRTEKQISLLSIRCLLVAHCHLYNDVVPHFLTGHAFLFPQGKYKLANSRCSPLPSVTVWQNNYTFKVDREELLSLYTKCPLSVHASKYRSLHDYIIYIHLFTFCQVRLKSSILVSSKRTSHQFLLSYRHLSAVGCFFFFTVEAEIHLDTPTVPAGKLCFHHSPHTGIALEIFVLSGQSRKWSQSLFKKKRRQERKETQVIKYI